MRQLAPTLARIIVEHLLLARNNAEELWHNSIIIPVPMEITKMKKRGYNQAAELAQHLGLFVQTPFAQDVLMKIKKTPDQKKLSKEERQKNLAGAFIIKNNASIAGKKVFLVDDVYTTGSTMEACATVLLGSGATQVWGIAFAREG